MSLLSRFFRKAPSSIPVPSSAPQAVSSNKADKALPKPGTADRALAAAAEERALQSAIDARDVQALGRLVVAGASTRIRQAAADAVEDPDVLRQLIREVRGGNDKSVYRILTSKRDALLAQTREWERVRADINEAAEDLERHSRRAYDAIYSPRLDEFERRWNALAAQADPELRERVQPWIDRSRATIAEHLRQMAAQASRERAAADAATEARHLREQEARASAAAEAEQAGILEEQRIALADMRKAEQRPVRDIGELIRKARGALSEGRTSRAASVRRAIDEKLTGAPPLPAQLVSQIEQLDQKLDELKDWKHFSVTPKRAELVEEIESLIGSTLDPQELAERIKDLKEEWRTLGKGVGAGLDLALEAESQRFHETAKKAYEPCREYFAAQALIREENFRRRGALLVGLTAFEAGTHGEQADWRAVIKTLRDTKLEWRRCSPVDRDVARQQQEQFMALAASLQGRLDAEYASNLKERESLIERAQQLLASDDARKAIDTVKALQQKWRTVGPVPRAVDQRLWEEFRRHCDAVFQKREQDAAAYAIGLEHNKTQAIALCEQIEQIAALEGAELLSRAGERIGLRSAFEALGELPRTESRELRNRLDQGLDRCEKALARERERDAERSWDDLFEAFNQVRAYRLAVARDVDTSLIDSLKAAAEACIAAVPRWPKSGLDSLKRSFVRERAENLAANERTLRTLCIRAEILTDTATPAEDQSLRRDYQLQRLAQRMGQGLRADEANLDMLAIEWVSAGPVEDAAYEPLLQRFRHCRGRTNSRAS